MAKKQKSYTPEFKQQIVDLYNAGGTSYPQLEREYGVNRSTLSSWVKQLSPIKGSEEETATLKEYKALQMENQRLKIENEILKKRPPYSQKNNNRDCDFYPEPSKPLHGIPAPLNDNGTPCSVKRVQRHMAKQGLRSVVVKNITTMQTTEPSQMIK